MVNTLPSLDASGTTLPLTGLAISRDLSSTLALPNLNNNNNNNNKYIGY